MKFSPILTSVFVSHFESRKDWHTQNEESILSFFFPITRTCAVRFLAVITPWLKHWQHFLLFKSPPGVRVTVVMRNGTLEPISPWWCDWQTPPLSIVLKSYSLSCPQATGHIRECQCSRGRTVKVCVSFTRAPMSMLWLETSSRCDCLRVRNHKPKIAQGWSEVV